MKPRHIPAVLVCLFLFTAPAFAQSTWDLRVRVVHAGDGTAIENAEVQVFDEGVRVHRAYTGVDGWVEPFGLLVSTEASVDDPSGILSVYPNPALDRATVQVRTSRAGLLRAEIVDLLGRVVERGAWQVPAGTHRLDVGATGLPAGVWFARTTLAGRPIGTARIVTTGRGPGAPSLSLEAGTNPPAAAIAGKTAVRQFEVVVGKNGFRDSTRVVEGRSTSEVQVAIAPGTTVVTSPTGLDFVRIRPGSFIMGYDYGIFGERPAHPVTLTRTILAGRFEVTQAQWTEVMGSNPSHFKPNPDVGELPGSTDRRPVERVSPSDAMLFANVLSIREGLPPCYDDNGLAVDAIPYDCRGYRLPMEAEWEYVARAGQTRRWLTGYSESGMDSYAWTIANSGGRTHDVGTRAANAWGLHDVAGNVFEWMYDRYATYPSAEPVTDPILVPQISDHAIRGGAWDHEMQSSSLSFRGWWTGRQTSGGVRLVRTVE